MNCMEDSCDLDWVDSTALYCMFMGDCGNYFNWQGDMTFRGYSTTERNPRSYTYEIPLEKHNNEFKLKSVYNINHIKSGNEFDFSQGTREFLNQKYNEYATRMRNTDHVTYTILPPSVEVDIDSLHTAYCEMWRPPETGNCNVCELDTNKPCSEYRCNSLGENCVFVDANGIGKCFNSPPEPIDPNIKLTDMLYFEPNIVDLEGIAKYENNDFAGIFKSRLQYKEDILKNYFGFSIDKIEAGQKFLSILETDIPVKCRLIEPSQLGIDSTKVYPKEFSQRIYISTTIMDESAIFDALKEEDSSNDNTTNNETDTLSTTDFTYSDVSMFEMNSIMNSNTNHSASNFNAMRDQFSSEDLQMINGLMGNVGSNMGLNFGDTSSFIDTAESNFNENIAPFVDDYIEENIDELIAAKDNFMYNKFQCYDENGMPSQIFFIRYGIKDWTGFYG